MYTVWSIFTVKSQCLVFGNFALVKLPTADIHSPQHLASGLVIRLTVTATNWIGLILTGSVENTCVGTLWTGVFIELKTRINKN